MEYSKDKFEDILQTFGEYWERYSHLPAYPMSDLARMLYKLAQTKMYKHTSY